ncbi:zinc finger protein 687a [Chanos chanos]|uniref:Zinc finger protein 687a n=1 Tax=Chanos chanos TaxID=29144 RepID=A0A6J2W5M1_CHACN|nr:zinc finger protein 687 [Chanos chanos]
MGDMKTPDFDDLLAAFDIPDIDAKEAIQSAPEDSDGSHSGSGAGVGKAGAGGPNLRPPSPPETQQPPPVVPLSSQNDPPVVSVIVKNRVRSDAFGEGEEDEEEGRGSQGGSSDAGGDGSVSGGLMAPRLGPRIQGLVSSEPLIHNGFEAASAGSSETTLRPPQTQTQSNGELWTPRSPKTASEGGDAFSLRVSLPLPPPSVSSSSSSPSQFIGPLLPRSALAGDEPHLPSASPIPPSTQPFNGTPMGGGVRRLLSEDEDSEPDLGSPPLVIQESPDSQMCSPPPFPRRHRSSSGMFHSPSPSSPSPSSSSLPAAPLPANNPQIGETAPIPKAVSPSAPHLVTAQSRTTAPAPANTVNEPPFEERSLEHIIEERDSPESPDPEMPSSSSANASGSAPVKKSSSPAQATPSLPSAQSGGVESGKEGSGEAPRDGADAEGVKSVSLNTQRVKTGDGQEPEEGMEVDEAGKAAAPVPVVSTSAKATGSSQGALSRPLKVRIKTIKTPTGSITRTVTRVAPRAQGGGPRGQDGPKNQPEGRKVITRPKRPAATALGQAAGSKVTVLPVSTLHDASTAMLMAASKAQNKIVSATAVSITKTATLPSVSSSSPSSSSSSGGINVRTLGQKTVNGNVASTISAVSQASKPASIVNSPGAVISRSQSSLVEAFNRILNSKNLLPSYRPDLSTPPPPEWGLPMPAAGYRCLECGDSFALERSLARHYDRRSLRIEVTCNHCAKRLAFFNKCSLLLHAREHKERGLVMQCSHLVMRPVSVEQMIGQQDTTPIGVLSPSVSSPLPVTPSPGKEESPAPGPQVLLPLPCKNSEPLQYVNNRCPECKTQFNGRAEVVAHFQEVKASATDASCTQCSPPMLLPNPCSAAAHQRIHKSRPPHVCPECGGIARQASFNTHLHQACLHYARRIGYRCSSCQVVFGGLNSVKSHIQTTHCEVFHKCPSCPMAFKSAPSAQTHFTSQHPNVSPAQAKMIYKCVMCETVFTQKALLFVHFDTHLAKQKVHIFKCPDCTKLYAQRGSLMEHMKTAHRDPSIKQESSITMATSLAPASSALSATRGQSGIKMESSDGEEWGREQEEEEEEEDREREGEPGETSGTTDSKTNATWSCAECQTCYTDKENYITHMAEQHNKMMKKFPCTQCEGSFSSSSSLRRHIRVKHKGMKRTFLCQLCTERKRSFMSRLLLEKHIQEEHGGQTPQSGVAMETKRRSTRFGDVADSSSEHDGGPAAMGGASMEEDNGLVGANRHGRGGVAEEPEVSGFRCMPCGFVTEDKEEFLQHIPTHRGDGGGALQCQQCGACFASGPPPLSRHRFISHRVRDAPRRQRRGRGPRPVGRRRRRPRGRPPRRPSPGSPWAMRGSQGEEKEGKLACRVCGRRFDKATDLNTHFRTHGMAFITAHKTDKPA